MKPIRQTALMLVAIALAAGSVTAQEIPHRVASSPETPPTLAEALDALDGGDVVRVRLHGGERREGRFAGALDDRIVLEGEQGPVPVAFADVEGLWRRERATGRGAAYGAVVGGLSLGAFVALMVAILPDDDAEPMAGFAYGAVGGAVGGGLTGALVGSAFPRWTRVWGEGDPPPGEHPDGLLDPRRHDTGVFTFAAGFSRAGGGGSGDGGAMHASLTSTWGRHLRHGLEYGQTADLIPEFTYVPYQPQVVYAETVRNVGYRAEILPGESRPGRLEPFAVVGAGVYFWKEDYLGFSYGLGLRWRQADGRLGIFLEGRRHENLQHLGETDPLHETALLGLSFGW